MPSPQFDGRKLYYVQNVFLLSIEGTLYSINEPIGWDKILITITFDRTIKGFKFEFSDKDVTLEFDRACGFENLRALYEAKGTGAQAGFKFGEIDSVTNVLTIHYEAQLNFDSYLEDLFVVKMNCQRQSFSSKFRDRFDMQFDLESVKSIGGDLQGLIPPTKYTCFLHPSFINTKAKFNYNANVPLADLPPVQQEGPTATVPFASYFTQVPPFVTITNDIEGLNEPLTPAGELIYSGLTLPPGVAKKTLGIKGTVKYKAHIASAAPEVPTIHAGIKIYKKSLISTGVTDDLSTNLPQTTDYFSSDHTFNGTINADYHVIDNFDIVVELKDDEALFIKLYITPSHFLHLTLFPPITDKITVFWELPNDWKMDVINNDFIAPTTYQSYKIFDVLKRMLELVTDKVETFKSDFFEIGCGRDHFLNSGKQLRSVPSATLPLSVKDVIMSCDTLWNMGGSFERDDLGNEWFRLEPMPYFFRDIEVLKLDVISNYQKSPALEFQFNELEFGMKKYPQGNEPGSANDFMTKFNFSNPIKNFKQKLSKICQFLLSPYYINYAIQNSFDKNSTKQFETDNDIFMISHKENPQTDFTASLFEQIIFRASDDAIIVGQGLPIVKGDTIIISGSASNNFTLKANKVIWSNENGGVITTILTNGALVDEVSVAATLTFSEKWIPKRDEQFDTIENVESSPTTYNLQHHIKIIFKRWSNYFLTGVVFVKDNFTDVTADATLKYLSASNNKMVKTKLKVTEACQTPMSPVYFGANGPTEDIDSSDETAPKLNYPIFGKSYFSYDTPLNWDTLNLLRRAYEGRDLLGNNYGYIKFLNPYGVYEKGFPIDFHFNPIDQTVKIKLIEKYNG